MKHDTMNAARGLAAAVLLALAASAWATAGGPDFCAVTGLADDETLNIREAPNPHAANLGEIPPDGTCIRNLGCQGGLTFQEFTELSEEQEKRRPCSAHPPYEILG